MRPDKRKRNRGRNYEKTESGAAQETKVEEKNDSKPENVPTVQKEIGKTDVNKTVSNVAASKDEPENQPAPPLRRETDALKETKKFSKRQIFSNWDKYDEPIVPEEEDEILDDFGMLIQRNFSGDEHFKFKFQQQWESGSCNINQDLFTLNLERLSVGLSCIPYYKRLNLPTELFSEDELQRMQDKAKASEKEYEILMKGEPVPLLEKLKECLVDQTIDDSNINSDEENVEVSLLDIGKFAIDDNKVSSGDFMWNANQKNENVSESHFIEEMKTPAQVSDENVLDSQLIESKKKENQENEKKVDANEKNGGKLNSNKVETIEADKNQGRKRSSNKKRETENNLSVKADKLHNSSTNVIKKDPQREKSFENNESAAQPSTEGAVKKDEPVKKPEVTVPLEAKNFASKNVSKVDALGEDEGTLDSLLSLKKSAVSPFGLNKNKVEDEDVLDTLLSLKEPTMPQFDLSQKVEDEEHEADSLVTNVSSIVIHEKKENLEEWLDSMLDD